MIVICARRDDDGPPFTVWKVALAADLEWSVEAFTREVPSRKINLCAILKGEVVVDVDVV